MDFRFHSVLILTPWNISIPSLGRATCPASHCALFPSSPDHLDKGPGPKLFTGPLLADQFWILLLPQAHGLRWSMLLLLATPFKTVLTFYWYQYCYHFEAIAKVFSWYSHQIQVTVKFMPVHTPTPEEETDPILFAKVLSLPENHLWLNLFFLKLGSAKGDGFGAGGSSNRCPEGGVCQRVEERKVKRSFAICIYLTHSQNSRSRKCEFDARVSSMKIQCKNPIWTHLHWCTERFLLQNWESSAIHL